MKQPVRNNSLYGAISMECAVTQRPTGTPLTWRDTCIPVLCVAFSAALAMGAPVYAFGLYGGTLKKTLHLQQSQLDTLSSANFLAGLLSWLPGMCVDKRGPRWSMTVGGCLVSLGLMGYYLVAVQWIVLPQTLIVPVLCMLGLFVFMSNALVIGSVFKSIVVSCGLGSRGSAVGAAKGYVGVGSGVYTILFEACKHAGESELDFLPMAAFFSLAAIALPAWSLLPHHDAYQSHLIVDVSQPLHYKVVWAGLLVLAAWVLWTSAAFMFRPLVEHDLDSEIVTLTPGTQYFKAIGILVAWFGPILSLFFLPYKHKDYTRLSTRSVQVESSGAYDNEEGGKEVTVPDADDDKLEDLHLTQMLQTVPAWLFLWTCTILVGSGTMMTNNMAQIVESRGFSKAAASACLALFSVSQAFSRVAVGEISERAMQFQIPRPAFLVLNAIIGVVGHAVLSMATLRSSFVCGVVLSGTAFGMVWPLMVLIIGDIFGVLHHGQNYMFYDGFTSAIGTLVVSKYIVQAVYEDNVDPLQGDGITCYGLDCFRQSQVIVAWMCLSCVASSVAMLILTRSSYYKTAK